MNISKCDSCGRKLIRYGLSKSGKQRWHCTSCHSTGVQRIDTSAKHLGEFLAWLLSGNRQADMPGGGRSFRRRCQSLWEIWPLAPVVDEVHEVVFVDGIHLGRKAVVLIAQSRDFILGWYVARSENSRAWEALMNRIAPPDVVVTDGGSGFKKPARKPGPPRGSSGAPSTRSGPSNKPPRRAPSLQPPRNCTAWASISCT